MSLSLLPSTGLNLPKPRKFINIRELPIFAPPFRDSAMLDDLTLCSVSFHSGRHLAANYELTRQINGDVRWLVAQNGPPEELPYFTVVPGAVAPTRIAQGNQ